MTGYEITPKGDQDGFSPTSAEALIRTVEAETALVYQGIVNYLNIQRKDSDLIVPLSNNELVERAEEWALDVDIVDAVNHGLYSTPENPPIILPIPYIDLSHEEVVGTWHHTGSVRKEAEAGHKESDFWKTIKQWDSKSLCRFAPNDSSAVRFVAIETSYDSKREGPRLVDESNFNPATTYFQLKGLCELRERYPLVYPVDLFAGAVNAYRTKNKQLSSKELFEETYTWDVLLASDDGGCIAGDGWIPTGQVNSFGEGTVSFTTGMHGKYSRRMVMKSPIK